MVTYDFIHSKVKLKPTFDNSVDMITVRTMHDWEDHKLLK